jgi:hypothetical protein
MIKISDIVGALVRSVTLARIQADVVSSQASVEYLKDPTLRAFPVPRAEIQKAEIGIKLAVAGAEQAVPEPVKVAKKALLDRVPGYVERVLSLQNVQASPGNLRAAFGGNAPVAASIIVTTVRDRIALNPMEFTSKWLNRQKRAAYKLQHATINGIQLAMTTLALSIPLDGAFLEAVYKEALAFCEATPQALKTTSEVAAISGFDLDLAVTKEDVATLPEHLISEIRLSMSVENYEWATVTDTQGNIVNRLTQK